MTGVQDVLEVFEDRITITPKGVLGFLNKGLKGTKDIPYRSIVAIQHKAAGSILSGFLQFTIAGGNESKGGILASARDENTFMYKRFETSHLTSKDIQNLKKEVLKDKPIRPTRIDNNEIVIEIKEYIESKISDFHNPKPSPSAVNLSDEIQRLSELRDQGILSEDEFQDAKKKILG